MRRIEIAKVCVVWPYLCEGYSLTVYQVARNLQDCLAFASFKAQHGWQDRTISSIEPEVTEKLKRKRHPFDEETHSDASYSSSDEFVPSNSIAHSRFSRPSTATFKVPDHAYTTSRKRIRSASTNAADSLLHSSWKQEHGLALSSPALRRTGHSSFDAATLARPHEDSPMFDVPSEDEDDEEHLRSMPHEATSSIISSSPPRTPPPSRRVHTTSKQSGADLLLYLANSPSRSPAINVAHMSSSSKDPPSTPPPQHSHLPSSVMNTPGNNVGLFNGAIHTPGQNFSFADFCNVTPSPGPAQWGNRTPSLAKTPGRLGRRGLNFDSLAPPTASPNLQRKPPTSQGLALQLGEELLPRS
jgi:Whi5 like